MLLRDKHLLSIRDLDLSDHLEALADAGVTSFKIEGRLKDADYVKNVVSHLRRRLDALLERRPELGDRPASLGRVSHDFTPDPAKTFQRGLSTYRLDGERRPMGTPEAAGHLGEFIGTVRSIQGDRVVLDRAVDLHPGDGLAFVDGTEVAGTAVNAVEGRQVFVQDPSRLRPGTRLHRNLDHAWLKALRAAKVERRIPVRAHPGLPGRGRAPAPGGRDGTRRRSPGGQGDVRTRPGSGGRPAGHPGRPGAPGGHALRSWRSCSWPKRRFVPVSRLNALRREAAAGPRGPAPRTPGPGARRRAPPRAPAAGHRDLDFTWNVANQAARAFYERAGAKVLEPAAELQADLQGRVVMTTRHCLRYELGWCPHPPQPRALAAPARARRGRSSWRTGPPAWSAASTAPAAGWSWCCRGKDRSVFLWTDGQRCGASSV